MKKTKIALLSISALLGAATLVGCGNTGGDSAHPGEETETSTSDGRRFNIYFSQEPERPRRQLGNRQGHPLPPLEAHLRPGGTYTLEVLSGNVEVDNHVIVAKGYGNFKIKISAVSEDGKNTQTKSLTATSSPRRSSPSTSSGTKRARKATTPRRANSTARRATTSATSNSSTGKTKRPARKPGLATSSTRRAATGTPTPIATSTRPRSNGTKATARTT